MNKTERSLPNRNPYNQFRFIIPFPCFKYRIRKFTKLAIFFIFAIYSFAVSITTVNAETYYVDINNGDDNGNGSYSTPWKTISKANGVVRSGDTVTIKSGTYREKIEPLNSGRSDSRITFTNYNNDRVLVTGPGGVTPIVINSDYITIEGLYVKMDSPPTGSNVPNIDIFGNHNEVLATSILNEADRAKERLSGIREIGIRIGGGEHNRIEDCTIKYLTFSGVKLNTANHTKILNNDLSENYSNSISVNTTYRGYSGILIENNLLGGSSVSDGIQFNGDYSASDYGTDYSNRGAVIRNNVIMGSAENGIDLKGTAHILVENNIIYGSTGNNDGFDDGNNDRYGGAGGLMHGAGSDSRDVIIRGNIFYDNNSAIQIFDGWKVYNNTILGNNRDYTGPNSSYSANAKPSFVGIIAYGTLNNASIMNNIIAGHNVAEVSIQAEAVRDLDLDYNLYYNTGPVDLIFYNQKSDWSRLNIEAWKSSMKGLSNIKGSDQNSIVANPKFLNFGIGVKPVGHFRDKNMFQLHETDSRAVDAGGALSKTANSGTGKNVKVIDAGFFTDGFGVVEGDSVKIGQNEFQKVVHVDYDNNVLTLDKGVSWALGDLVYLEYHGEGPDIGAVEVFKVQSGFSDDTLTPPTLKIITIP